MKNFRPWGLRGEGSYPSPLRLRIGHYFAFNDIIHSKIDDSLRTIQNIIRSQNNAYYKDILDLYFNIRCESITKYPNKGYLLSF